MKRSEMAANVMRKSAIRVSLFDVDENRDQIGLNELACLWIAILSVWFVKMQQ